MNNMTIALRCSSIVSQTFDTQVMKKVIKKLLVLVSTEIDHSRVGNKGFIILDVRSEKEYTGGHIKGSINIPADILDHHMNKLKSINMPIVVCCSTGTLSNRVKKTLKSSGFDSIHCGGKWKRLANKVY